MLKAKARFDKGFWKKSDLVLYSDLIKCYQTLTVLLVLKMQKSDPVIATNSTEPFSQLGMTDRCILPHSDDIIKSLCKCSYANPG